jgi:Phage integrase family
MQILTSPEIRRLLDAADEPTRTLLLCAVLTGMRRGELLGLRWEDIDLEGHRVFVRRALWRGKIVTTKSRRSRRTIDMAPTLRSALTRLPSRFQGGLVFCRPDGKADRSGQLHSQGVGTSAPQSGASPHAAPRSAPHVCQPLDRSGSAPEVHPGAARAISSSGLASSKIERENGPPQSHIISRNELAVAPSAARALVRVVAFS